ncbi:acyl-CoA N-acyltransferase [Tricharina praecox]|uniref:acyl-CoA N-acyltransferase n=1 Tax=Tricharina praecox TaxID=43433 RepID=UPI002220D4A3|nr:acyl-CoA N-acyltransferase [Tricharina praecox]KAI5850870.1 acyl-CoA N-acyltransferase [Tricharina praecox]
MTSTITLRHAVPSDIPQILTLIHALAAYEREPPSTVAATESSLLRTLFPSTSSAPSSSTPAVPAYARVLLAFLPSSNPSPAPDGSEEPAGIAIYFPNYSTWRAAPGLHLEDLFVRESYRGRGVGTALLSALARETRGMGGQRLEWSVLKWNEPSIKFYESLGAENLGVEWQVMRVSDEALTALAARGPEVEWASAPSSPYAHTSGRDE